jgi:hypothetical protein
MTTTTKLILIKLLHTLIWVFFNVVIFYLLYAVIINKIDIWLWTGFALVGAEAVVLIIFKNTCPVTIAARKYSNSTRSNFDIYLPEWIARYNKLIYSLIMFMIICLLVFRLIN